MVALGRTGWFASKVPATARGDRIYVVGDVHGRLDLIRALFAKIAAHLKTLPRARTVHVVLLGDLVDRGPDSAGVLKFVFDLQKRSDSLIVLKGNHEEMMLRAIDGEPGLMAAWLRSGGDATFRSFGIEPPIGDEDLLPATRKIAATVPGEMLDWLRALPLTAKSGDYLFCHAGIRPGIAINRQSRDDLLWIRREFLEDDTDHGLVIVHGHSVSREVEMRHNRIGIDTGAYRTGVLTGLYLEDYLREVLSTGAPA